jgi:3-phosphoshikimate 1-carboxyvinyltransferase
MSVPGDLSSAAFLIAAAALLPGSELLIRSVGVNPTRTGFLDALQQMGARIVQLDARDEGGEPAADLLVRGGGDLKAIEIGGGMIPRLIDEVPLLAVIAAQAEGTTVIRDAAELRVKETDRLRAVTENLRQMGAEVEERPDGLVISGPRRLRGAWVESFGDHRIAMAFAIAGLVADGVTVIAGAEWADVSFPGFFDALERITVQR